MVAYEFTARVRKQGEFSLSLTVPREAVKLLGVGHGDYLRVSVRLPTKEEESIMKMVKEGVIVEDGEK